MKRLIVFYSLEGNTEYIADKIAEKLDADKLKLVPKTQYATKGFKKFFWGGKAAVMAEKPELEPYDADLSAYDEVIIGFPVWAGNITPPIRTFVSENVESLKNKDICTFACESGAGAEKAFGKLGDLLGIADFKATVIFIDPKAKPSEENKLKLDVFCEKL